MIILSHKDFSWKGMDLIYRGEIVVSLIPHEKYEKHYHLKFCWRDEKTPEFFNLINARENARLYGRRHSQGSLTEPH